MGHKLEDLSSKKCVPCNAKEMRAMTEQAANELISQVPKWTLVNENGRLRLSRSWKVKTYLKGLEFFQAVANVAEAEGISLISDQNSSKLLILF
ncbi:hypothetical protein RHGRI_033443 [Rhododendron griersonianum]|uniref:4a-hydroxytetrahydrobiopterin dehydratase n=1 Tax=Rhododendron griersonianum TaxID=479676 RepID=A0AAV6I030_9ERIC|nr:hypothetical protein RHGRI_033443 [Rhododendron griersonianum]